MTVKQIEAMATRSTFPGAPQFPWAVATPDGVFILATNVALHDGEVVTVRYTPEDQFAFLVERPPG